MMISSVIALAVAQGWAQPPIVRTQPPPTAPVYVPRPPISISPPPAPPPPPLPPRPPGLPPTPARVISGSLSDADYPAAAIRAEAEGTTTIRLQISPQGLVTGCEIVGSSGNASLDTTACQVFTTRFRFQPATRNGVPAPSSYTQSIVWQLPDDAGPTVMPFGQGRFTQVVEASPAGVTACRITLIGETFTGLDYGQCEELDYVSLAVAEDMGAGHPPVRVTQTISLLPEGDTLVMPPVPGAPYWEETADIEVAPDGSVTTCTQVSQAGSPPAYSLPRFQPVCENLKSGYRFTSASGTEARRARLRSALYVDVLEGHGRRRDARPAPQLAPSPTMRPLPMAPPTPPPPPIVAAPSPPPSGPLAPPRLRSGSISDADYPASAIRAEAEGTTIAAVMVGANGRVTSCQVSGSSGDAALDSTACALIRRRFRYDPATRGGVPVEGSVTVTIPWRLPYD